MCGVWQWDGVVAAPAWVGCRCLLPLLLLLLLLLSAPPPASHPLQPTAPTSLPPSPQVGEPIVEARAESAALAVGGALLFGVGVWAVLGEEKGAEYFAGYLLEQSLSGGCWAVDSGALGGGAVGVRWRRLNGVVRVWFVLVGSAGWLEAVGGSRNSLRQVLQSPTPPPINTTTHGGAPALCSGQPVCLHPRLLLLQDPRGLPVQGVCGWGGRLTPSLARFLHPSRHNKMPPLAHVLLALSWRCHGSRSGVDAARLLPAAGADVRYSHGCDPAPGADCGGGGHR